MSHNIAETQALVRLVRHEMGRHSVDCGEVEVSISHGVIHLYGKVRPLSGHEAHFESEVTSLLKALLHRPGIRDVVVEWTKVG